jgi:flagellar protein FliJ
MNRRDRPLRLKKFQESSAGLKVASLQATIHDFERIVLDLSEQIDTEEQRTRMADPAHFAYSTLAKAARMRRSNLATTTDDLKAKLEVAKREHQLVTTELRTLEAHECERPADPAPASTIVLQPNDALPTTPCESVI